MIDAIKNDIKNHLNREVKVVSKENRNKTDVFYGYVSEIYSHVFLVSNGSSKKVIHILIF